MRSLTCYPLPSLRSGGRELAAWASGALVVSSLMAPALSKPIAPPGGQSVIVQINQSAERTWRLVGLDDSSPPATEPSAAPLPTPLPTSSAASDTAAERPWRLVAAPPTSSPETIAAATQALSRPIPIVRRPRPFMLNPYLSAGVPSGFVAEWGDYYITGSAGTAGKLREGDPDGSLGVGFGLGDAQKYLAVGVDWGIGSIKNFNTNGGIDVNVGRVLVNQPNLLMGLAGGVISLYSYGDNEPGIDAASPYGALSVVTPLRPSNRDFQQLLQFSIGAGGSDFAPIDANFEGPEVGIFASLGVEITRNTGISVGWSGRGANASLSYVPFVELPLVVNLTGVDLFNQTPYGAIGILSVSWGANAFEGVF